MDCIICIVTDGSDVWVLLFVCLFVHWAALCCIVWTASPRQPKQKRLTHKSTNKGTHISHPSVQLFLQFPFSLIFWRLPFQQCGIYIFYACFASIAFDRWSLCQPRHWVSQPWDNRTHLTVADVLFRIKQHNCRKVKTKRINHINSENVHKYVQKD